MGWPRCCTGAQHRCRAGARAGSYNRATHKPHAIEGHLVVEVLHHVVPPLVSLWVGEVWEGRGAWPDLQEGERWAEPPTPHTTPPPTTAPQRFLSHSRGPAAPARRALSVGTGAAPHTHLPDQGLPRGVSDEHPSLQALIVGLVGAGEPRAADPSILEGHKARALPATTGNGQPCLHHHPGAAEAQCQPALATHHNHDVPQPTAVEVPHHLWVVLEAFLVEGENSLGICVIQVVPLHILWMEAPQLARSRDPTCCRGTPTPWGSHQPPTASGSSPDLPGGSGLPSCWPPPAG